VDNGIETRLPPSNGRGRASRARSGPWRGIVPAVVLGVALSGLAARAATVARQPSESDDDLMGRVLAGSAELAQKVVRSTEIARGKLALIGFALAEDDTLIGHLLIERSPDHFEHVQFPTDCDEEGGPPTLEAVFFARTVKGGGRDLGVLCTWEANGSMVNGALYSAFFYRVTEAGSHLTVEPVADLNKKFKTGDFVRVDEHGKWRNGPKPKFKTVADVKKLLKKMGIDQGPVAPPG
jgi:hypothetical protein